MAKNDLCIIFPPQWSPFQPFLSLPSLKAYLEGRGHNIRQEDWNVDFYEYFISPKRVNSAMQRLENYYWTLSSDHEAYRNQALFSLGILKNYNAHRKMVDRLRSKHCIENIADFYECVISFRRLLHAFSIAEPVVDIGTSTFSAANVMSSMHGIDEFCLNVECNPFIDFFKSKIDKIDTEPRYFGISVIGTEQVLPALTLGRCLKDAFPEVPIIVGGSVFSRLVERVDRIKHFIGRYFDVICRYEGEAPMDAFLTASNPLRERTPGIAFVENSQLIKTPPARQLSMQEIPTPDFDGLNLQKYFTPDVVLPVLTTRGCYWDKCAFCYHGMIYGDRYRMRSPAAFAQDIEQLNQKYGVRHFALNDEAIPPKLFEKLPEALPRNKYFFTGLYKFEKYFRSEHFQNMYDTGFRSLYIGLESASERVQRHMKKDNTQAVMIANLRDAHAAGIWNHTFNFFGFPTETRTEAEETVAFLIDHADIIHSEGTGTFSFEHNAPIFKNPDEFGVTEVIEKSGNVLELYYEYSVTTGLSAEEAAEFIQIFADRRKHAGVYQYGGWIPREQLLVLLSYHRRDVLRNSLSALESSTRGGLRRRLIPICLGDDKTARYFIIDWITGKILETNKDAVILLEFCPGSNTEAEDNALIECFPALGDLVSSQARIAGAREAHSLTH